MESELARNWWLVALRGVLAIVFGLLAFLWPGLLWLTVVYLFAAYAFLDGGMAIATVIRKRDARRHRWALLLEGIVGIAAGVLALAWPGITELVLLYMMAGWSIATGVLEIMASVWLQRYSKGGWLLAISGVLSIVFGMLLALMPVVGLIVVAWWAAAYWIAFGALLVVLAFRLRSHPDTAPDATSEIRGQRMAPRATGGASP